MKTVIYQILPRLWGNGKFSAIDSKTLRYFKSLGVDCVWYTGIPRHATGKDFVKGDPGSPYAVSDWYDTNPYLADDEASRMAEFRSMCERTHAQGLKVCTDFIPNHVARDYEGSLPHFDHCDYDWTDTLKLDWSRPETIDEMERVLRFWMDNGVDAFRCDMVELVPAEALGELTRRIKAYRQDAMFIAEVYNTGNYRRYLDVAGFDYLYDKSGSYDILRGILCNGRPAWDLTSNWQSLGPDQDRMVNFLENHDEQRIASEWFCGSAEKSMAALAFSALFNNAAWMIYFGQEVGENAAEGFMGRTSIFEWCRPDSIGHLYTHITRGGRMRSAEADVFARYREIAGYAKLPAFRSGFNWDLGYCQDTGFDHARHFAFMRFTEEDAYLVFCNFSDKEVEASIVIPAELYSHSGKATVKVTAAPWDYRIVKL